MTDHMLDIADPLTGWRRRQQERAQRRAEGKAEQVRAEGHGEATGNPLGLSYDEIGLIFSDWGFARAFDKTIGRALDDMRSQTLLEMDEALAERDRQLAELRAQNCELKGLVGGLLTTIGQRDRSRGDEAERLTAAIDKLEARNSQMQDLVSRLQAEVAELRGQLTQIGTREKGEKGDPGERGPKGATGRQGARGDPGLTPHALPTIKRWQVDTQRYVAIPILSDNSVGPGIELLGLFKQYNEQTTT
jgi:hypothetical protein